MSYGRVCAFWTFAVVTVLTLPAVGQSVISTHSGIVYFCEGNVYLDDQLLESHPGKFSRLPQGSELRTAEGRAEVLLTPGVFVRIGESSTIRMIANELSDTRVELLAGSAIVNSGEPNPSTSVTIIYRSWAVRFLEQGVYRIDSDPPRLWVLQGKAQVASDRNEGALSVGQGMDLAFVAPLMPQQSINRPEDALSNWAEGRQEAISADNAIAANIQDPASPNIIAANIPDPASISTSNSGYSFVLSRYTYLPFILGAAAGWKIYHDSSSTAPRRSAPPSPWEHLRSAYLLSQARPSSPRTRFVQPVRLPRRMSAGAQFRLGISLRPVSRVGTHGNVHR